MTKKKTYHNKAPFSTLHPNPEHWTRKQGSRSWKQKEAYDTEDEAEEYLNQNPRLKAMGAVCYRCGECNKWHISIHYNKQMNYDNNERRKVR